MKNQTTSTHEPSSSQIYSDIGFNRKFCKVEINGSIIPYLAKDDLSLLSSIEIFVDKVINSDDLGYKKVIKTSINAEPRIHFSALGLYRYFNQINSGSMPF